MTAPLDLAALRGVAEAYRQRPEAEADFEEAFEPPTVLALLDRLEHVQQALAEAETALEEISQTKPIQWAHAVIADATLARIAAVKGGGA